ncbi:MAG: GatB/YqeY domain-containing protein [Proteobacteria bacterium]|nr:GatB/YqeY domain-containing protein [Pseudomonadota bacterium]
MSDSALKQKITEAMKAAMRARDKPRLGTIRLALSEIKRVEVDERIDPDDTRVIAILDKMLKQRRESIRMFEEAGRTELADQEKFEITVLQEFLPQALSAAELDDIIQSALAESGAENMKDMGKVMGLVKPQVIGRADMGSISAKIKAALSQGASD